MLMLVPWGATSTPDRSYVEIRVDGAVNDGRKLTPLHRSKTDPPAGPPTSLGDTCLLLGPSPAGSHRAGGFRRCGQSTTGRSGAG